MAKRMIRVNVTMFVEFDERDGNIVIDDVYTDLNKAKVKYNGRSFGRVYDWTTETVEEIGGDKSPESEEE